MTLAKRLERLETESDWQWFCAAVLEAMPEQARAAVTDALRRVPAGDYPAAGVMAFKACEPAFVERVVEFLNQEREATARGRVTPFARFWHGRQETPATVAASVVQWAARYAAENVG